MQKACANISSCYYYRTQKQSVNASYFKNSPRGVWEGGTLTERQFRNISHPKYNTYVHVHIHTHTYIYTEEV